MNQEELSKTKEIYARWLGAMKEFTENNGSFWKFALATVDASLKFDKYTPLRVSNTELAYATDAAIGAAQVAGFTEAHWEVTEPRTVAYIESILLKSNNILLSYTTALSTQAQKILGGAIKPGILTLSEARQHIQKIEREINARRARLGYDL